MKKFVCLALVCLLGMSCLLLAACHYQDTNGPDDFSLQTITDEDIIHGKNVVMNMSVTSSKHVNGQIMGKFSVKKFSGIKLLETVNTAKYSKLEITCAVYSGNCRLVLIQNNQIVCDLEINGKQSVELTGSDVKLTVAGESANLLLEYTIS